MDSDRRGLWEGQSEDHPGTVAGRADLAAAASLPPTGVTNSLHARYPEAKIGRWSYGDLTVHSWGEGAKLSLGAFCSIAPGVQVLLGGEHRPDWVTTFPFTALWPGAANLPGHPRTKGDVTIGNDVWIGTEALILSGVSIGDGAVVAARSVVAVDIEPYSIVAGVPARLIRKRFDDATIARLLAIAWWEWSDEAIDELLPLLVGPDIDAFLRKAALLRPPAAES
jgi:chloramphenicol O-acetyltransferase type B